MDRDLEERILAAAIYEINGAGWKLLSELYEDAGSMKEIFEGFARGRTGIREKIRGRGSSEILALLNSYGKNPEGFTEEKKNLLEGYEAKGIHFTYYYENAYPKRLKSIPGPPFGIYYLGKLPDEDRPVVSIIGARDCSEYGRRCAELFGKSLAEYGVQIVSGMARGIDGTSQKAALSAGGETYAVLGSGVDVCYPSANRSLYEEAANHGGILSEYKPGTEAKSTLFPARNRIIAGLSDLLLVVEARHRSGTYITVCQALEQGREIFAVPGRITDGLSDGCNQLIKDGAGIASDPKAILDALMGRFELQSLSSGFAKTAEAGVGKRTETQEEANLTGVAKKAEGCTAGSANALLSALLRSLEETPQPMEVILKRLSGFGFDLSYTELLCELTDLCLLGKAEGIGNYYRKT